MSFKKEEVALPVPYASGEKKRNLFDEIRGAFHGRTRAELFTDILVFVCALLFARTHALFGVYPFALALLCALRRHTLSALFGATVGALTMQAAGPLYITIYISVFLLRLIFSYAAPRFFESRGLFDEHPLFRVLEACLAGSLMAAYELALFGVYDYTVLFALGAVLLPPLLTLLYAALVETGITLRALVGKEPFFKESDSRTGGSAVFLQLGGLALFFSLVLSLRVDTLFGLSLSRCALSIFTLFVSRRFGGVRGCCTGLILGLAEDALYIPSFGLLGLLSGLYSAVGMPCALAAAVLGGGAYAVYVGGLSGFLSVVPELCVSALLSWPFLRMLPTADREFFSSYVPKDEPIPDASVQADGFARAYREISELLAAAAQREKEDGEELSAVLKRVKGNACRRCAAGGVCTEEKAVLEALKTGNGEGVVCAWLPKMQAAFARERAALSEKKRLGGEKGAFSSNYALHARLLEERERCCAEAQSEDAEMSCRLKEMLEKNGFPFEGVSVLGKRKRRILLRAPLYKSNEKDGERLCAICSEACGESFPTLRVIKDGRHPEFLLESAQTYVLKTAVATRAKGSEEPSGDRALGFDGEEGMAYAALSDGMGSGRAAADAAELCVGAISSLLSAGAEEKTALSLVGNLLCAGAEECSVSLDLLSVDLYNGKVRFHKSGAAASFMKRADTLYRIRARTIPLGVVRETDAEEIELSASEGDLLILLSDGVMGGNEDGGWLKTLLLNERTDDLSVLAEKILAEAEKQGAAADDRTALIARLCAAEGAAVGA